MIETTPVEQIPQKPFFAFTVATPDYMHYAVALEKSFKKHNPNDHFYLHRIVRGFENDEEKIGYAANIRCVIVKKLLQQGFTNILYMDADSIIRQSVNPLKLLMPESDILAFKRFHAPTEMHKFLISTIFFRNTPKSVSFVNHWIKNTYSRKLDLMTVQPAFYQTSLKSQCKIGDLPLEYTDYEFGQGSPIWCAKGMRKDDPRYVEELEKYVERPVSNV